MMTNCVQFGVGTLHMGGLLDEEASRNIIRAAIERGVSFFDTAPLYGNGFSEEILGKILSDVREPVIVCTKVGLRVVQRSDKRFGVEVARLTEEMLRQSVEQSLKRLRRESIELLLLHAFDPHTPFEETYAALLKLYDEGKIRSFGCSNFNPKQLRHLVKHLSGSIPFSAAQCHYNLIERRAERSFIPLCKKHSVPVVVNRALARGALSGQYAEGKAFPEGSRASLSPRIEKWLTSSKLELLNAISKASLARGVSLMEVSLKWLLKNDSPMIVLLGARSANQLTRCLEVRSTNIKEDVFREIEEIIHRHRNVYQHPPRYFEK